MGSEHQKNQEDTETTLRELSFTTRHYQFHKRKIKRCWDHCIHVFWWSSWI